MWVPTLVAAREGAPDRCRSGVASSNRDYRPDPRGQVRPSRSSSRSRSRAVVPHGRVGADRVPVGQPGVGGTRLGVVRRAGGFEPARGRRCRIAVAVRHEVEHLELEEGLVEGAGGVARLASQAAVEARRQEPEPVRDRLGLLVFGLRRRARLHPRDSRRRRLRGVARQARRERACAPAASARSPRPGSAWTTPPAATTTPTTIASVTSTRAGSSAASPARARQRRARILALRAPAPAD